MPITPRRNLSEEEKFLVKKWFSEKKTTTWIHRQLNTSSATFYRMLKEAKIPYPGRRFGWDNPAFKGGRSIVSSRHGMTVEEYENFLATGCAISKCTSKIANRIDHDHSICPQKDHSCEKCRRGALCHYHNSQVISIIDAVLRGEMEEEIAYTKQLRERVV